jgi:hypothetical protein
MNGIRRLGVAGLVTAAIVIAAPIVPSAVAKGGGVKASGACTASTTWSLKVNAEDGGTLATEFQIDDAAPGSTWSIRITDDGSRIFSGKRTANAVGGAKVTVSSPDLAGNDAVKATAKNKASGEVCSGSVTL